MKLSKKEREAMLAVKDGADIYDRLIAEALRSVERKAPGLLEIVRPMSAPKNGAMQQPYFGAILTAAGRKAAGAA